MTGNKLKETNSTGKQNNVLNIKWNALDAVISLAFLVVVLTGVYFGSAKLIEVLAGKQFFNSSNINNASFAMLYGIQTALMLGLVWFFAIFRRKSNLRDLGLRYYSMPKTIWYTFLSLLAIFFISFLYMSLMNSLFGIEGPESTIEKLIVNKSVSNNILLVVVVVVAPFSEEVFFRGFLYSAFKKSWGVNAGLFLSSFLFAIAHMVHLELLYSFIPLMIIGWLLAYLFEKTKSLFMPIFLHGVYNLILVLILLGELEIVKVY